MGLTHGAFLAILFLFIIIFLLPPPCTCYSRMFTSTSSATTRLRMQEEKNNAISTVEYARGQLGDIAVRLGYAAVALSLLCQMLQFYH